MRPTVLITRPPPGGAHFAQAVAARFGGAVRIVESPILRIVPCGALPEMRGVACLIFTSQHGVARYVALGGRRDLPGYAVGAATATAAQAAGLKVIACGGDARAMLARILSDGAAGPFLHLRGVYAAADIAADLRGKGLDARQTVLYRQVAEPLVARAHDVLMGLAPVILPLFSPRSAALLFEQITPQAPIRVVAMSQAVATRVPSAIAAAAQVSVATRPDAASMLESMTQILRVEGGKPAQ